MDTHRFTTAGLLSASRMPFELDTVEITEHDQRRPEDHVCCLADCGPACTWPCSSLCSGSTGCRLLDGVVALVRLPVRTIKVMQPPYCVYTLLLL